MSEMFEIETERLTLTRVTASELDELSQLLMDEELYRYTGGAPSSMSEARARVSRWVRGSDDPGIIWINMVVRIRETGTLIGLCQATIARDDHRTALESTLAYIVGTAWQRRRYAAEMMRAFDAAVMAVFSPAATTAHIASGHVASETLARTIGLTETDKCDADGEWIWVRPI